MPRFSAPPPNSSNRKVLEQRAREAAMPAKPQEKGRWPFVVAHNESPKAEQAPDAADSKQSSSDERGKG